MIEPRGSSKEQAAAYAGCETLSAFNNWIRRGIMPGPIPGTHRWDRKAIDAALDRLSGLQSTNSLTTTLADGTVKTYWYAWKGGPRIDAQPGTAEFVRLTSDAVTAKMKKSAETFRSLIDYFKDQSEYTSLGDKSKRAYDQYLKLIDAKFGSMPIGRARRQASAWSFQGIP
jgi:hypothetical protein